MGVSGDEHVMYAFIKKLLRTYPELRNDFSRLISEVYFEKYGTHALKNISAQDFLNSISAGRLISPETILKLVARVQNNYKELRRVNHETTEPDVTGADEGEEVPDGGAGDGEGELEK